DTTSNYETRVLTPRQRIFLDLLDELPESEADNLLKTLEEKKQYYNMIYEEISKKKARNAS
ncbi:phage repressor protein, partial [Escherichia coli]